MLYFVNAERKRLQAKKTLKSMFGGSPTAVAEREIAEPERPPPLPKLDDPSQKEQFFDDDDGDSWQ